MARDLRCRAVEIALTGDLHPYFVRNLARDRERGLTRGDAPHREGERRHRCEYDDDEHDRGEHVRRREAPRERAKHVQPSRNE